MRNTKGKQCVMGLLENATKSTSRMFSIRTMQQITGAAGRRPEEVLTENHPTPQLRISRSCGYFCREFLEERPTNTPRTARPLWKPIELRKTVWTKSRCAKTAVCSTAQSINLWMERVVSSRNPSSRNTEQNVCKCYGQYIHFNISHDICWNC